MTTQSSPPSERVFSLVILFYPFRRHRCGFFWPLSTSHEFTRSVPSIGLDYIRLVRVWEIFCQHFRKLHWGRQWEAVGQQREIQNRASLLVQLSTTRLACTLEIPKLKFEILRLTSSNLFTHFLTKKSTLLSRWHNIPKHILKRFIITSGPRFPIHLKWREGAGGSIVHRRIARWRSFTARLPRIGRIEGMPSPSEGGWQWAKVGILI